jgi:hypothetical protein
MLCILFVLNFQFFCFQCWQRVPGHRPPFKSLETDLADISERLLDSPHDVDLRCSAYVPPESTKEASDSLPSVPASPLPSQAPVATDAATAFFASDARYMPVLASSRPTPMAFQAHPPSARPAPSVSPVPSASGNRSACLSRAFSIVVTIPYPYLCDRFECF